MLEVRLQGEADLQARRDRNAGLVAYFGRRQGDGSRTSALPPDTILLLTIAVTIYPICFRQVCRLIVGEVPDTTVLAERFDHLLASVGQCLSPP